MSHVLSYDVVVVGSGSAGFSAAMAARNEKASVCLIEKGTLGGECPNTACVPGKALLYAAKQLQEAKKAKELGVQFERLSHDFSAMGAYRDRVIETITGSDGVRYLALLQQLDIALVHGEASFVDKETLEVGDQLIRGKAFVIATGSEDVVPPIAGLSEIGQTTWRQALRLTRQPKSVAIIGGGPVGVELATFFSAIDTRTLLFLRSATVLEREDQEIAALAQERLRTNGVEVFASAGIHGVINARGGIYGLKVECQGKAATHAVEEVILAVGKRPRVSALRPDAAGVSLRADGSIQTDNQARTTNGRVFAAGDVNGGPMFTHVAHYEGTVAGHNAALFARGARAGYFLIDERVVPHVIFAFPEIASVGLTQKEASEKFGRLLIGKAAVAGLGRSVTDNARDGLVKLVAHAKNRRVLGCHILSERAGEMIHEAALAIHLNATVDRLASMIHAYPTYSEGLKAAASSLVLE